MFKAIKLFLTKNNWKTYWSSSCKSNSYSPLWGEHGKVNTVVKFQYDEQKKKYRCIVTDGISSNKIDLNYILTTSKSTELLNILNSLKINY